jgi:hypothetical protein
VRLTQESTAGDPSGFDAPCVERPASFSGSVAFLTIGVLFLRALHICLQVGYVGGVLFLVFAVATLLGVF